MRRTDWKIPNTVSTSLDRELGRLLTAHVERTNHDSRSDFLQEALVEKLVRECDEDLVEYAIVCQEDLVAEREERLEKAERAVERQQNLLEKLEEIEEDFDKEEYLKQEAEEELNRISLAKDVDVPHPDEVDID